MRQVSIQENFSFEIYFKYQDCPCRYLRSRVPTHRGGPDVRVPAVAEEGEEAVLDGGHGLDLGGGCPECVSVVEGGFTL